VTSLVRVLALAIGLLCTGVMSFTSPTPTNARIAAVPLLAYYYIWFDEPSWDRAKIDYPSLGRYSSDDPAVVEQHILWAKAAGIDGFIVSWKSTQKLDARLDQLVSIAAKHDFKLVMIYQALDFSREPLPIDQIRADLDLFRNRWAAAAPFQLFDKPLVIVSGTREFTPVELRKMLGDARTDLLVLASERSATAYAQVADLFDGDAYYWSSVDPELNEGYVEKLTDLSEAIHETNGLWLAPAAPGFDARLVGGTRVIDRRGGDTLRTAVGAALQSSPDAVGIISWNEFSENTHIEPSVTYGREALRALAQVVGADPDASAFDFDSDDPAGTTPFIGAETAIAAGALLVLVLVGFVVTARRSRRAPR
jgi:hypothetical protein